MKGKNKQTEVSSWADIKNRVYGAKGTERRDNLNREFESLKATTISKNKRTSNQTKILEGMDKVNEKLIRFKRKMNSELVILKDGKIVRIKP